MSNRVIKDSIWDSPTLGLLPDYFEDQFPRWLLLADDWGCFNANAVKIKGDVYPNRVKESPGQIEKIKQKFAEVGLLFLWTEGGREWGYFVSFDSHHSFCNKTSTDEGKKRQKHRRKTPEPPKDLLDNYLKSIGTMWDNMGHLGTKGSNPNPNPNPNPKHRGGEKKSAPKEKKSEPSETVKAEAFWIAEYERLKGKKPLMTPAKDRTILKELIGISSLEEVKSRMTLHLTCKSAMLTIGGLKTCWNDDLNKKPGFETRDEKHEREVQEMKARHYANHN